MTVVFARWLSSGPGFLTRSSSGYYRIKGHEDKLFPSVTTVLKIIDQPGLAVWQRNLILTQFEKGILKSAEDVRDVHTLAELRNDAEQAPTKILSTSSAFGVQTHDLISRILLNDDLPATLSTPELTPIRMAFDQWKEDFPCVIDHSERLVYSTNNLYAGTADALGHRSLPDGSVVRFVLDWKTSSFISPNFALQLAAYAKACEEMDGIPITEAWIVAFDKRAPTYRLYKVVDLNRAWTAFRATLSLWRYMQATAHFTEQDPSELDSS